MQDVVETKADRLTTTRRSPERGLGVVGEDVGLEGTPATAFLSLMDRVLVVKQRAKRARKKYPPR